MIGKVSRYGIDVAVTAVLAVNLMLLGFVLQASLALHRDITRTAAAAIAADMRVAAATVVHAHNRHVQSIGTSTAEWSVQGAGDFLGSGHDAILWRSTYGYVGLWTLVDSVPTFVDLGYSAPDWSIQGAADFTERGKADILWRNNRDGEVGLWTISAGGTASYRKLGRLNTDCKIAGVGDFNGDGHADILLRNADGQIYLWDTLGQSCGECCAAGGLK
jgi:hypothetical protein